MRKLDSQQCSALSWFDAAEIVVLAQGARATQCGHMHHLLGGYQRIMVQHISSFMKDVEVPVAGQAIGTQRHGNPQFDRSFDSGPADLQLRVAPRAKTNRATALGNCAPIGFVQMHHVY